MITREQPEIMRRPYVRIVRPTAREAVVGYPLADLPELFLIHRYQKRTIPCQGEKCLFCAECIVREDRIYLPLWSSEYGKSVIVDLPASHFEFLCATAARRGGLRKSKLLIQRAKPRDNAPIMIRERPLKTGELPRSPFAELHAQLDAIFCSNVEFAAFDVQCQNSEAEISRVVNVRQST